MNTEKKEVRRIVKGRLTLIDEPTRESFSEVICRKVLSSEAYRKAKTVFCYLSFGKEVITSSIIADALKSCKIVAIPLLSDGKMYAAIIDLDTEFCLNTYGIKEPIKICGFLNPEQIELAIIPLIAFDESLSRLGRGGGYYDSFLTDGMLKLAVAYELQKIDCVPSEAHDVKMDCVVTEKKIYGSDNW